MEKPTEAEACWRRVLALRWPDQFCSVDQGIYGHLTLRNMAVLAGERNEFTSIIDQIRGVPQEGDNVTLTIDSQAQQVATQALMSRLATSSASVSTSGTSAAASGGRCGDSGPTV